MKKTHRKDGNACRRKKGVCRVSDGQGSGRAAHGRRHKCWPGNPLP